MSRTAIPDGVRFGADGLVTAVIQDAVDGRVLMVGHMDEEAIRATLADGEVHFHSRSRDRLWRKGETSGNVLRVRDVAVDCDGDALLLSVDPVGPTCHRGVRSCFDADGAPAERRRPRASRGSRPSGRRSKRGPPSGRRGRTRRACSTAASTRWAAR